MAGSLFWLSDAAWAAIEPHLPKNLPGARCVDDRRVISGIVHMLKCGGRWQDCPSEYGPSTTIYNRWNQWNHRNRSLAFNYPQCQFALNSGSDSHLMILGVDVLLFSKRNQCHAIRFPDFVLDPGWICRAEH